MRKCLCLGYNKVMNPGDVFHPGGNQPASNEPVQPSQPEANKPAAPQPAPSVQTANQPSQKKSAEVPQASAATTAQNAPAPAKQPNNAKQSATTETADSKALYQWETSEYIEHQRSLWWFVVLTFLMIVGVLFSILVLHEWLGAIVIVLMSVSIYMFARQKPKSLICSLSDTGVTVDQKFYPYSSFRSFTLVSDGGITSLEFDPLKRFAPALSIFISPNDEANILDVLEAHLARGEREHSAVDRLARSLKI